MITFFKNAWLGKAKLWKAFWLMPLLLGVIVMLPMWVYFTTQITNNSEWLLQNFREVIFGSLIVSFPLSIYLWVCWWRCAFNCAWKGWGYIVRVFVVFNALCFVLNLVSAVLLTASFDELEWPTELHDQELMEGDVGVSEDNLDYVPYGDEKAEDTE